VESEGLLAVASVSLSVNLDDVETDGLGEGSALTDGHDVTLLHTGEGGGAVSGEVLVSLLESVVLLDVMQVVSSDNDGSSHLSRNNNTLKDSASNGDVWGEGALLVNILSLNSLSGSLEAYNLTKNEQLQILVFQISAINLRGSLKNEGFWDT
jgi:hypothetical protein